MLKLNQAIAIEKGVKSRAYSEIGEIHKLLQKPDLVNGFLKSYQKSNDEGLDLPNEIKKVQINAEVALKRIAAISSEAWDVEATKDLGNTTAFADVVVEGQTLLKRAPATLLLFLEKQLTDLRTLVDKVVVLSDDKEWAKDEKTTLWKSEPRKTHRTEKVQKAIVKYDATPQHPAQTEMVTQDVLVGYWTTVDFSGGLPTSRRRELLDRIDLLTRAVKSAREQANLVEVEKVAVGQALFDYILK